MKAYARWRGSSRRRQIWTIALAVLGTLALVLVAVNFITGEKKIEHRLQRLYSIDSPQFSIELSSLLGPPLVGGNRVVALYNGDEIFAPMLQAIRSARQSIDFESYIYWSGPIGQQFAD